MVQNNSNFEIESELFALVKSIRNLYEKFQEGKINDIFFRKAVNNATKGLMKINFYYKEKNISFKEVLVRLKIYKDYTKLVEIFNDFPSSSTSDATFKNINRSTEMDPLKMDYSFLELPRITLDITTAFITLMDALKLEDLHSKDLIFKLFHDLKTHINKFPDLEQIKSKINTIYEQVLKHSDYLSKNTKYREMIGDKLYQIFKEFQEKLKLDV
jgi:hypothetical protein